MESSSSSPYQQPPHHYMTPPPPPGPPPDPHYPSYHQPPPNTWHPTHFQYHSPPPPQHNNHWGPPPPPPLPPQQPYPAHPPHYPAHPQQPYPQQQTPPPPPPPQSYNNNQDWGNANWTHHSGWEYPAHSNEEDWAAKARAWASARSTMENQHSQPQFTPVTRQEESPHYANQHPQPVESHYQDVQPNSHYQGPVAPLSSPSVVHHQEPTSIGSYGPDAHFSFAATDGAPHGDMSAGYAYHQGPTSSSVHQQEVPSSYSSVPGKEDGSQAQQHGHSMLPANGRSLPVNQAQFAYGNHALNAMDQPLEFAQRFSYEDDPKMNFTYPDSSGPVRGTDAVADVSSLHVWTAPGATYPPATTTFPSAPQHDPSIGLPPLPGQPPLFGRGSNFQPPVPSITTPIGLSVGTALHPNTAFPVDAYGASLGSERPKKAAVPNWLREEIIKTKATFSGSASEHFKEGSESVEDELIDKSTGKGDQADSKGMDSARSSEDDDDEDEEEARRTAAINQEIKRVLTEVLLKVTDELFDEIAAKVLSEDDLSVGAAVDESDNRVPVSKVSPPSPPVPASNASAKVLVPVKAKDSEERASGESSSGSPGNILGLANYASDEDDENQTSSVPKSDSVGVHGASENGHPQPEAEERRRDLAHADGRDGNEISMAAHGKPASNSWATKDLDNGGVRQAKVSTDKKGDGVSKSTDNGRKATVNRPDVSADKHSQRKSSRDDSLERDGKRNDRHASKRSSSGRGSYKERESSREKEAEKDESRGRRDERHQKKDKAEDSKKERERDKKEKLSQRGERERESDPRKRSPHQDDKDGKKERDKKSSKDETDKKRERTKDDKGEKSRHKSSSDGSRHKRRRSSSVGSRGKPSKESTVDSDGSSDEASEDSRRKVHSRRRDLSPSPVRSRRRQVSRSPHSKRTERRHSPYSSLDDSRGRRSRSRSPVRRHR